MPKTNGFYRRRRSYRGRKYRRTLAGKNIYQRTSARAQSGQIMALRNRVNAISRSLRPETQIWNSDEITQVFDNSSVSKTYYDMGVTPNPLSLGLSGTEARLLSCNLNFSIEYADNYSKVAATDHQRTCSIRFILIQLKAGQENPPLISEIMKFENSGPGYELNTVKPLEDGITSQFRIIGDWRYSLSDQKPIILRRLFFRRLSPLRWDESGSYNYVAGSLYLFVVTAGLHWDSSYSQQLTMSLSAKVAYTDN